MAALDVDVAAAAGAAVAVAALLLAADYATAFRNSAKGVSSISNVRQESPSHWSLQQRRRQR